MNVVGAFLGYEGRKFLAKDYIVGFIVLLTLVLGFVQYNTLDYKDTLIQVNTFQDFENKKVDQFFNYRIYSTYGFRLMFLPAPVSIFFTNSVTVPDLNAFADGGERFNVYKAIYGKKIFELRKNLFSDFSSIIFLIGGLLALFYGYAALTNEEYLRFLASFTDKKHLFKSIFLSRVIWILAIFFLIMVCSFFLVMLNGMKIPIDWYVFSFFVSTFLILVFFFMVGFACGTAKTKLLGLGTAILIWVIFIFIFPTGVDIITVSKARNITPINELEWSKLKIFLDWEKEMIRKEGVMKIGVKPSASQKELMIDYKKNELKNLQELEDKMITQMENNARFYQFLSALFPTTFYQSVNNEISSRGYNELINFCRYAQKLKIDFIMMIIEKEYFTTYTKVEPFNKDNANVYHSRPGLPSYFLLGFILTILYISGALRVAYSRFNKILFGLSQEENEAPKYKPKEIKLERGKIKSWLILSNFLNRVLYNFLSNETRQINKKWPSFKVILDGVLLNNSNQKQHFIYLCHVSEFPGQNTVSNFLRLIMDLLKVENAIREEITARLSLDIPSSRKLSRLNNNEKGAVILAILDMKPFAIYLIDDIAKNMPFEFCASLDKKMFELWDNGAAVLHLFSGINFHGPLKKHEPLEEKNMPFCESNDWLNTIDDFLEEKEEIKDSDKNQ